MTNFAADVNQVSWFYESGTYGTTLATAQWPGQLQSHSADESTGVIPARYAGTAARNVGQFIDGPTSYQGRMTVFPQDFRFLKFAFGSCVDGGSPSPFQHNYNETTTAASTLELPNQSVPSFGVEDAQVRTTGSNLVRTFKGCLARSLAISASEGEPVTVEVDYVAQSVTYSSGAVTSVTAATTRPYIYADSRVMLPSGTNLNEVKSWRWSVANNLDTPNYCDASRNVGLSIPGPRDYEFTVTLNATEGWAKPLYDQYFQGGSTFNMLLPLSLSVGSRECFIAMSGCKLIGMPAPTGNAGTNEWTLTIRPQTCNAIEFSTTQYHNAFSGAGF